MPEYDNTNRGVLFVNDKDGNDKRPDFTGRINVDGNEKRLAAWKQESKSGQTFLSITVSDIRDNGGASSSSSSSESTESESSGFDW